MPHADFILLHPPSVYDFRKKTALYGPISDVVPSTPIYEMYPIGFMTIAEYLERHGHSVRIINVAMRMLKRRRFTAERLIESLKPLAFGIDLHWLAHAQGSLEIAGIVKKYHPHIPVIFGGLSASYYHEELIRYPQVDYVVRGDSAEEPLRQLIEKIKRGEPPEGVPNVTWRNRSGGVQVNEITHISSHLNNISFDYRRLMKSSVRYRDLIGHSPFLGWFNYPIVAVIPWKGCVHNCVICGGSARFYQRICGKHRPSYRSPQQLADDIGLISKYIKAPIIILNDIRQAGDEYAEKLLKGIEEKRVNNHIAMELFYPASRKLLESVARSIPNFNIQISPESHDEEVRRAFGRAYDNRSLEKTIESALELGCRRVDLFFMIGLPKQTFCSVQETVMYCERLLEKHSGKYPGRIHPYISPLSPFLDPGSLAFEDPQRYGYRLFYKTVEEHRKALLQPSWKYILNYETEWMSRDEIVAATYEAAHDLNRVKARYGLISRKDANNIEERIREGRDLIQRIDETVAVKDEKQREIEMAELKTRLNRLKNTSIGKKNELQWPARLIRFNLPGVVRAVMTKN